MSYWFFLSYARRDAKGNPWLEDFYTRLAQEIGRAAGLPASIEETEIGFYDKEGLEPGVKWPDALAEALQSSRVLVCLYSRSYFKSEYCGKEFAVFSSRIASYTSPPDRPAPRLIIPVLWDRPGRLPDMLPAAVADIQYSHADFGDLYAAEGLGQLMRLKKDTEVENFIPNLADRIVVEAERHTLPRLVNMPPLKDVPSAFYKPPPAPDPVASDKLSPGDLPPTATPPSISGPDAAWYVYLAGRDKDYKDVRKYISCYGDKGGYQWKPHLPPKSESIGAITPRVAGEKGLTPQVLPLSKELVKHLRKAEEDNTIALLIVDAWSVRVKSYKQLMLDYDQYRLDNCGVIIVWNVADGETPGERAKLEDELREAFKRNLRAVDEVFRDSIQTAAELQTELSAVIEKVRERLRDKSKPARPVPPNGGESFPNLNAAAGSV